MSVPNLPDSNGVEFLKVDDCLSVHYERWVQIRAMVDQRQFVSWELPRFYLNGFNSDTELANWLAQQARQFADEVNSSKEMAHV